MKQVRLSKQNIEKMESMGFLTSDEINLHISKLLATDVHGCTQEKPNDFSSLIPLLSSLVEATTVIAKNTSCVSQRTLMESPLSKPKSSPYQLSDKQRAMLKVWFDKAKSGMGEDFDREIDGEVTRNIRNVYKALGGYPDLYLHFAEMIKNYIEEVVDLESYEF